MDIFTHAVAGAIIASPLLSTAPITACGIAIGSVLPDTDAISRVFGKVAFIRWHQTYSHSIPVILGLTGLAWGLCTMLGCSEPWAALALGAGMLLHVGMDASNTYGVALLAPITGRRYALEWVFFIDATVIAVSVCCFAVIFLRIGYGNPESSPVAIGYGCFLVAYWSLRAGLHRLALRATPPGTISMIPSAALPWKFYGLALNGDEALLFESNLLSSEIQERCRVPTFDSAYRALLDGVAEYWLMRGLSVGYFAVEATPTDRGTKLICRDLRIRNFGGKFGELEAEFDGNGQLLRKAFHV